MPRLPTDPATSQPPPIVLSALPGRVMSRPANNEAGRLVTSDAWDGPLES
jgi:hypothetical protein